MVSLQFLFLPSALSFTNNPEFQISRSLIHGDDVFRKRKACPLYYFSSSPSPCITFAVERDSQQFEVDTDKARESLQDLDQQLESLSEKQIRSHKIKPSEMKFARTEMREEMPEISDSFLVYSALVLLLFTIFYNVLFYTVIKPSIDVPEIGPSPPVEEEIPKAAILQNLPFPSDFKDFHSILKR